MLGGENPDVCKVASLFTLLVARLRVMVGGSKELFDVMFSLSQCLYRLYVRAAPHKRHHVHKILGFGEHRRGLNKPRSIL